MSEREQLREALAEALAAADAEQFGYEVTSDYEGADAVLAVLDQQGWVSPEQWKKDQAAAFLTGMDAANVDAAEIERLEAERDAALREVARYEQVGFATVPRDLHTHSAQHQERWIDHGCVPLYRQVTEGGQ